MPGHTLPCQDTHYRAAGFPSFTRDFALAMSHSAPWLSNADAAVTTTGTRPFFPDRPPTGVDGAGDDDPNTVPPLLPALLPPPVTLLAPKDTAATGDWSGGSALPDGKVASEDGWEVDAGLAAAA